MASKTEIANLALSHLGVGKEISNLDTDRSEEASACRRFFDIARDAALRDIAWPFATRTVALAVVEEDPNDEWGFSYRYPSGCLKVQRILSGQRVDTQATRVVYKIGSDATGSLIYTDQEEAEIEYTHQITDTQQYAPDFTMALSFRLAAYICPRVTGGDTFRISERIMGLYRIELARAAGSALNEEQPDEAPDSEFISARN